MHAQIHIYIHTCACMHKRLSSLANWSSWLFLSVWKEFKVPADQRLWKWRRLSNQRPTRMCPRLFPVTLLHRQRRIIIPSAGTHKAPLCSPTEPLSVDGRCAACRSRLLLLVEIIKDPCWSVAKQRKSFYSRPTMLAWCLNGCCSRIKSATVLVITTDKLWTLCCRPDIWSDFPESWMNRHLM